MKMTGREIVPLLLTLLCVAFGVTGLVARPKFREWQDMGDRREVLQANIELISNHHPTVDKIRISGGLASLDGLCQKLADLSGLIIERPAQVEGTARGIAWQAAGCPDEWPATGTSKLFTPDKNDSLSGRYTVFIELLKKRLK